MNCLPIEDSLKLALRKQFVEDEARELESKYFLAKSKLEREILPDIARIEPNLTDHGPDHIRNVLENAYSLIKFEIDSLISGEDSTLSPLDLYCLCQGILFHDVGNLYGRSKHNQRISKVINENFDQIFDKKERRIIIKAGRAHTGKGSNDSKDTLKDLDNGEHINGKAVRLRDIAAIIRFADELAEGPQRTSKNMLELGVLSDDSIIHHKYASITEVFIDPGNSRISLTYEIELVIEDNSKLTSEFKQELLGLLNYIYHRIHKLDQERKYASYYCDLLKPIKKTMAKLEFSLNGEEYGFQIPTIILDDLVIPGTQKSYLLEQRSDLIAENIIEMLEQHFEKENSL